MSASFFYNQIDTCGVLGNAPKLASAGGNTQLVCPIFSHEPDPKPP